MGETRLDISDEYLTTVETKIGDYSYRFEPKEVAMNLDTIQDPVLDFVPGTRIYIPKNSSLKTVLGL